MLFVIAAEFLPIYIHNNSKIKGITLEQREYIISQFVDDTTLTTTKSKDSIDKIFNTLNRFASGLKINKDKTEGPITLIKYPVMAESL